MVFRNNFGAALGGGVGWIEPAWWGEEEVNTKSTKQTKARLTGEGGVARAADGARHADADKGGFAAGRQNAEPVDAIDPRSRCARNST